MSRDYFLDLGSPTRVLADYPVCPHDLFGLRHSDRPAKARQNETSGIDSALTIRATERSSRSEACRLLNFCRRRYWDYYCLIDPAAIAVAGPVIAAVTDPVVAAVTVPGSVTVNGLKATLEKSGAMFDLILGAQRPCARTARCMCAHESDPMNEPYASRFCAARRVPMRFGRCTMHGAHSCALDWIRATPRDRRDFRCLESVLCRFP